MISFSALWPKSAQAAVLLNLTNWSLTISRPNDAPELDILSELDGASGFDPAREKFGSGKFPEQTDLAQKFLSTSDVDRRRPLFNTENKPNNGKL